MRRRPHLLASDMTAILMPAFADTNTDDTDYQSYYLRFLSDVANIKCRGFVPVLPTRLTKYLLQR